MAKKALNKKEVKKLVKKTVKKALKKHGKDCECKDCKGK